MKPLTIQQIEIMQQIKQLKTEKDIAILSHYYVPPEIQDLSDAVGDSYYLSQLATTLSQKTICFCGVAFMGESAKILSPDKKILMPDLSADCPMAHMASEKDLIYMKATHEDLAIVCYINSTTEIKALADVCVTSANALKVISKLPEKNIYFVPDQHLGHYIAQQLPEKNFIFHDGYCPVHHMITKEAILDAKNEHPEALVLAHPECPSDVLDASDYVGSSTGIIKHAQNSEAHAFIIATEIGILHALEKHCPHKSFYPATSKQVCSGMKENTLDKLLQALSEETPEVIVGKRVGSKASSCLELMLDLAK